jgi:hypothetical protein
MGHFKADFRVLAWGVKPSRAKIKALKILLQEQENTTYFETKINNFISMYFNDIGLFSYDFDFVIL